MWRRTGLVQARDHSDGGEKQKNRRHAKKTKPRRSNKSHKKVLQKNPIKKQKRHTKYTGWGRNALVPYTLLSVNTIHSIVEAGMPIGVVAIRFGGQSYGGGTSYWPLWLPEMTEESLWIDRHQFRGKKLLKLRIQPSTECSPLTLILHELLALIGPIQFQPTETGETIGLGSDISGSPLRVSSFVMSCPRFNTTILNKPETNIFWHTDVLIFDRSRQMLTFSSKVKWWAERWCPEWDQQPMGSKRGISTSRDDVVLLDPAN